MRVLSVIIGILMLICGVSCMCTPLVTFMDAGYFIVILVAVYGVIGIVRAIAEKHFGAGFVFSILSVIFGVTVLFFPRLMLLADGIMIYMTAAWFVLQGIISVISAIQIKKATGSKLWILQLIFGILGVILGCYSFFHPALVAVSIGFLIGFYFIETGFAMLFSPAGSK
ncbi:HdeD family acid-resistance protein [Ruminococcus sp.]|uniref:HdeD family acid-resistance protein n=1 Tax=Ruminococcus sp. TaxID=41978 RepID=UPI003863A5F7